MTAIAAVFALSSTPLIAQTVTAPADPAPTVIVPVITPAPIAPAAPMAAAPAVSDPLAPATSPVADATTAQPVAAPVKSAKSVSKTSTKTVKLAPAVKSAPPVAQRSAAEIAKTATAQPVAETTPIAAAPVVPVAPVPPIVAEATPVQSKTATDESDSVLPIAGAAGAGLLALAGLGVAVRRRKRDEDEMIVEDEPVLEMSNEQIVEPTFARSPLTASPFVTAPADEDEFHDDFDLSKYGPNVQAAYRGPTADNPSLSLRKRLKRGAALDQMARNAGDDVPAVQRAAPKPVAKTDSFMLRPSPTQVSFRPVLQS